jgi:undecaprenyl-diphosphatase
MVVDRMRLEPRYHDVMDYPLPLAFMVGLAQSLAMVPGVSRSGATIVAALLLGSDKRSATEFTFFLAMPTMVGAFAFDLYKNWAILTPEDVQSIALGFVISFAAGVVVVRYLLEFVSRHGFAPFAWWRIVVGGMGLGALAVLG